MEIAFLLLTKDTTIPNTNPESLGVAVSEKDEAKKFCKTFRERPPTSLPMYEPITLGADDIWRSRKGWFYIPNSELTVFDTLDTALAKV